MKIVLFTSSLGHGGAERVASTLSNAWVDRGDSVTLVPTFSGGGKPFYSLSEKVELIYLASRIVGSGRTLLGYVRRLFALRRLVLERKPDVIISFLPNVNVMVILSLFFLRIPLIICERSDPSAQPISKFWLTACKIFYRYADMLTVQTLSAANNVDEIYPQLKKVSVIPNPLPEDILSVAKETTLHNRKVLLSIGRLAAEKQVDMIISVFSQVASIYREWDLHVYGDGPLWSVLQEQIDALGMQQRIFLKGRTNEPWQIMASADAFVMTSRYEGFPNTLLEAMGVGLPCIAFDCPSGPRDLSMDGEFAMLVPFNDTEALLKAMRKVLNDETFSLELGIKARKSIIDRYRMSQVLSQWDVLFSTVKNQELVS